MSSVMAVPHLGVFLFHIRKMTLLDSYCVRYVPFSPDLASAFADLNREWIERLFTMEPADVKLLNDPGAIVRGGGQIYFALDDTTAIGTAAAIAISPTQVELAKMAVTPRYQGRGIGQTLGQCAIDWARDVYGADTMFLETNSRLVGAIRLYERLGFVRRPLAHSEYARADVYMELALRGDGTDDRQRNHRS